MASREGEPNLAEIAWLLEDRSLTDSGILKRSDWEQRVKPKTRSLLTQIADQANLGKHDYYKVDGDNANLRECYDNVHWRDVDRLRLMVRLGPLSGADDVGTGLLYWGVFGWARNDGQYRGFVARLKSIDRRVAGSRFAEAPVAGVGGRYPMLLKSVAPSTLREQSVSELVAQITEDLRVLHRNLF